MQRLRCRKKGCTIPAQQTGRKPAAQKEDPKVTAARYDKSPKGKLRNTKRRWRQWAAGVKQELAELPELPEEPIKNPSLVPEDGTWTPVPEGSPPVAEPLPAKKRGQLPKDFWEDILERRAAFFRHRS